MTKEENEQTVAQQARALIEADKQARAQEAATRIDEVCKELRVQLVPVYIMCSGQGTHTVELQALD